MRPFPKPVLCTLLALIGTGAAGQVSKPHTIAADDFPVTDRMVRAHYCDSCTLISGQLRASEKVWFTNKTLGQTLVYQLYTDDFHQDIFLFYNDDIPAAIMDQMELYDSSLSNYASHSQRKKYFKGFLRFATAIGQKYFVSERGFMLGDSIGEALKVYGKPDRRTVAQDVEVLEWSFEGDVDSNHKKGLRGKPLAANSFGLDITMCFRKERLIGLAFHNAVP